MIRIQYVLGGYHGIHFTPSNEGAERFCQWLMDEKFRMANTQFSHIYYRPINNEDKSYLVREKASRKALDKLAEIKLTVKIDHI